MIKGLGTDILEIQRFEKVLQKHPTRLLKRLFTAAEQEYCQKFKDAARHYAARFSAKEAIAKALGVGFGKDLSFHDILISRDDKGKPIVSLSNQANNRFEDPKLEVSLSHCKQYVTATAIWYQ